MFIVNIDEHLYHPRLMEYLCACKRHGVTVILPEGYNMVSDTFPTKVKPLWKTIRYGARDPIWDKAEFFDPNRIEEILLERPRYSRIFPTSHM